jgi:hypothetical protein
MQCARLGGKNVFVFFYALPATDKLVHFLPKRRIKIFAVTQKQIQHRIRRFSRDGTRRCGFRSLLFEGGKRTFPFHGLGLEMHEPGPDMNFSLWHLGGDINAFLSMFSNA